MGEKNLDESLFLILQFCPKKVKEKKGFQANQRYPVS